MSEARNEAQEGATLLELLVALSLLALLSVYAVSAIRYLQNFDRVQKLIDQRAEIEAVRTHLRRSIENVRVAFLVQEGAAPKLAFEGRKDAVTFVTHADRRLEHGGLYLVRFGLSEDSSGGRTLVTARRAFRPRMNMEAAVETLPILDRIGALGFSYFGSPQEGTKPEWYADWPQTNVLPRAVRIEVTFGANDRRAFPPLDVPIAVAK